MGKTLIAAGVMLMLLLLCPPTCWPGTQTRNPSVKAEPGFVDLQADSIRYGIRIRSVNQEVVLQHHVKYVLDKNGKRKKIEWDDTVVVCRPEKFLQVACVVKNTGTRIFRAEGGQAVARLYELSSADRGGKLLVEKPVTSLAPGASLFFDFVREDQSPPAPRKAGTRIYRLHIVFRADLLTDARTDNDDRNRANDKLDCPGSLGDETLADGRERGCEGN